MTFEIDQCRCGNMPRICSRGSNRWLQCFACGTSGAKREDVHKAINAWNTARELERKPS